MAKSKAKIKKEASKALKRIQKLNKEMRGKNNVKVGLPKSSNNYPDGTSVIMVGAVHEFGSESQSVPERSYLRSTVVEKRGEYKKFFRKLTFSLTQEKMTMAKALKLLGLKLQADVRQKLTDISEPQLKYREGNPLVDTGHLRQSITYEVED